jgi:phosphoribosylformylglycinamidine synthase
VRKLDFLMQEALEQKASTVITCGGVQSNHCRAVVFYANKLGLKNYDDTPVPIVSGNVSLYNESSIGKSIAPSPIVCCVGIIEDYSKAITQELKKEGNILALVGERFDECGGSAYYKILLDELGV